MVKRQARQMAGSDTTQTINSPLIGQDFEGDEGSKVRDDLEEEGRAEEGESSIRGTWRSTERLLSLDVPFDVADPPEAVKIKRRAP